MSGHGAMTHCRGCMACRDALSRSTWMPMMRDSDAGSRPTSWQAASTFAFSVCTLATSLTVGVPGIAKARRETEHALATAADEDRQSLGTGTARSQLTIAGGVVVTLKVDVTGSQQCRDDLHGFFETADTVVVGESEGRVLGFMPAGTETEDQPAAADLVDGVGHLGNQSRIAEAGAGYERTDLESPGRGGKCGQQRPGIPGALLVRLREAKEEVVRQPEGIEADFFRAPRHRRDVSPTQAAPAPGFLEVRDKEADLERSQPCVH